jgi:RNA recognition motif-containing protein
MRTHSTGRNPRRSRGGSRSRGDRRNDGGSYGGAPKAPVKKTFWQRIASFFSNGKPASRPAVSARNGSSRGSGSSSRDSGSGAEMPRVTRKPESIEVTTPRLYVGNLSFDATESDLFELFNGVGQVQNAEVVAYKHNQRSKGFAFVQMQTVDEAKRAVKELHDKEFLGRKLVVSGAKSSDHPRD